MVVADTEVSFREAHGICEEKHAYLADMPEDAEGEAVWRYAKGYSLFLLPAYEVGGR